MANDAIQTSKFRPNKYGQNEWAHMSSEQQRAVKALVLLMAVTPNFLQGCSHPSITLWLRSSCSSDIRIQELTRYTHAPNLDISSVHLLYILAQTEEYYFTSPSRCNILRIFTIMTGIGLFAGFILATDLAPAFVCN